MKKVQIYLNVLIATVVVAYSSQVYAKTPKPSPEVTIPNTSELIMQTNGSGESGEYEDSYGTEKDHHQEALLRSISEAESSWAAAAKSYDVVLNCENVYRKWSLVSDNRSQRVVGIPYTDGEIEYHGFYRNIISLHVDTYCDHRSFQDEQLLRVAESCVKSLPPAICSTQQFLDDLARIEKTHYIEINKPASN